MIMIKTHSIIEGLITTTNTHKWAKNIIGQNSKGLIKSGETKPGAPNGT